MENFARSLLPVEIVQGLLKPNYDHKVRTRMKRSQRMKLFSPKFRTWIGQWNVQTLYESGKVAQLAAVDFCTLNGLSIGGTLFPHKKGS